MLDTRLVPKRLYGNSELDADDEHAIPFYEYAQALGDKLVQMQSCVRN